MLPKLTSYINKLLTETDKIPATRVAELEGLAIYISQAPAPVQLNFICTHNSRRSHISQIWAATAAAWFGVAVRCYSGGTEATAFNLRAVAAMKRAGFQITQGAGENPVYQVRFAEDAPAIVCFSKTWNHADNPKDNFAAIMTCSDADANCPFIPGATRISLTYKDPKEADDTPEESARYDERVRQIGRELMFAFSRVTSNFRSSVTRS